MMLISNTKHYLLSLCLALPLYASTTDGDYWKCTAEDSVLQSWHAQASYERIAINEALNACKKESEAPKTCKVAKEACEEFINGHGTRPMWRCTALDQLSKPWRSNLYTQKEDAALAAKAFCKQHSAMPDTCYINLLMCKNFNELIGS